MKLRLPFTLAFVAFALYLLLGPMQPFLRETAALTPFYATATFAREMAASNWLGPLRYAASFFQSCFALPWLGAALLILLLIAIAYATRWAFRLIEKWFGLCWILPLLLLTNYTRQGYLIYITKVHAQPIMLMIGALLLILIVGLIIHLALNKQTEPKPSKSNSWIGLALGIICFAASVYIAYTHSFRDTNFLSILQMKHAAEDDDWERVLTLARELDEEPTRAQVCLTRLALFKTGRMGNELFAYPDGSAQYNAPQQNQWLRLMIGPLLYYHYGKTGFAYRWAMEDMVEYGERPAYLRYLHSVAQLNGEEALAQRYQQALSNTLFFQDACAHEETEAKAIRPLLNYTDQLDGDNGLVEFYLLNSFALSEGGSREMVELSLMNGLITKNLNGFWSRFLALLPTWNGRIPVHYQEAALMMAQLQGGAPVNDLPIDPTIAQRFQRLVETSARMGDNASNATALRPEYGSTYWYYYFFVEGLKTN